MARRKWARGERVDLDEVQDHPVPPQRAWDDWCDTQDAQWKHEQHELNRRSE